MCSRRRRHGSSRCLLSTQVRSNSPQAGLTREAVVLDERQELPEMEEGLCASLLRGSTPAESLMMPLVGEAAKVKLQGISEAAQVSREQGPISSESGEIIGLLHGDLM